MRLEAVTLSRINEIPSGQFFAARLGMKEPSAKRQRTLAIQERALKFSCAVNRCCPERFATVPGNHIWHQLVRAADSTSNNLIEADGASSDADFLNKMGIALREAKESRAALMKLRICALDSPRDVENLNLESEAGQLAAIFAKIILNMRSRLAEEARTRGKNRTQTQTYDSTLNLKL